MSSVPPVQLIYSIAYSLNRESAERPLVGLGGFNFHVVAASAVPIQVARATSEVYPYRCRCPLSTP